jgi:hypothetical protein
MDGSGRGRRPPLELKQEFSNSRLEEQILIRAFEMVVPVIRRDWDDERSATGRGDEQFNTSLAKGA